ncbi:MAG: ribonuclease [Oscillospiraceae bacterium]|nr:ribonuclease [Oscillospiraceae bacterium]
MPTLVLVLALAYYLLPGGVTSTPQSAPTERPADELSLVTAPPDETGSVTAPPGETQAEEQIDEDGSYTTKEDVALYVHTYGHLPSNFVTKKEAEAAGWQGGRLDKILPGKCIGGDYFGNSEGKLPKAKGRRWTECDINTLGKRSRGPERLIFSNDGLIYYTPDHYESFELLYD